MFLRPALNPVGPTDRLKFLRALDHTEYHRMGLSSFRVEDQTLVVYWDLRWNAVSESKQKEIVQIIGKGWKVVGGAETLFRIDGEDDIVASYITDEVSLVTH
jgi:hypothetical protein